MFNPADYAKYAPEAKPYKPMTLIEKANEAVDIRDIYNQMDDNNAPSGDYFSWKIFCPFAFEHSDGGLDKNCRLYAPTHIYCWAMHGRITPVYLYARWRSIKSTEAAEELLRERGLLAPKNFRERWNDLMEYREERYNQRLGNKSDAVAALHNALKTDTLYLEHEYDEQVRTTWIHVLTALDLLWQKPETDATILSTWFERSLAAIRKATTQGEQHD